MLLASKNGHTAIVDYILRISNSYINDCNDFEEYPIIEAAAGGYYSLVELLVENGANIHMKDSRRNTAFLRAVACNHINVVRLLVEKGANVGDRDFLKTSALHLRLKMPLLKCWTIYCLLELK